MAGQSSGRAGTITANAGYAIAVVAAVGLSITLLLNTVPSLEPAYHNDSLHVAKETAAGLVLLLVATLLLGRFRRGGRLLDLLAFAAVAVLAGKALLFSVLAAIVTEPGGGLTTWRTTGTGMIGAALLLAAALAPDRVIEGRSRAIKVTLAGSIAVLGVLIGVAGLFELPGAFTDPPENTAELRRLSQDSALLVADAGAAVLFLIAGVAFARRASRESDEFQFWLGVGATIAGIAYLNYTLFPRSTPPSSSTSIRLGGAPSCPAPRMLPPAGGGSACSVCARRCRSASSSCSASASRCSSTSPWTASAST